MHILSIYLGCQCNGIRNAKICHLADDLSGLEGNGVPAIARIQLPFARNLYRVVLYACDSVYAVLEELKLKKERIYWLVCCGAESTYLLYFTRNKVSSHKFTIFLFCHVYVSSCSHCF